SQSHASSQETGENPLTGTLVVASKPSTNLSDFGTLASAQAVPPIETSSLGVQQARPAQASVSDPTPSEGKTCVACGATNSVGARFCQLCGTPFERTSGAQKPADAAEAAVSRMPDADLVVIAQDGSPGRR